MKSSIVKFMVAAVMAGCLSASAETQGPILHLPLNEGEGNIVTDAVSQKAIKIENPQLSKWGEGPAGAVLELCNKHQAMDRACITIKWPALDLSKPFTVMMKIKTAPDLMRKRSYQLAIIGGTEEGCFGLEIGWDMFYICFKQNGEKAAIVTKTTDFKVAADTWYKLVWVYDGKVIRTYVDGTERASGEAAFKTPGAPYIVLGANSYKGAGYGFEGLLTDFRIYNRALTADEIGAEALQD